MTTQKPFPVVGPFAILALTLLLPAVGHAAEEERIASESSSESSPDDDKPKEFRFEIGLYGGYRLYNEDNGLGRRRDQPTGLSPASAPLFGGRLGLNFNRWLSLEAEFDASKSMTRDERADLGLYAYRGSFLLNLVPSGPFRLFMLAGYGGTTLVSSDAKVIPNDTDGAFHAGGGFKIVFADRVGLRFDGRLYVPPSFASDVIPTGDDGAFGGLDWAFTGTLYVAFGEIISTERRFFTKEKVVVVQPAAPPPPPPAPEPPKDLDHDGIVGDADKCPTQPEDMDGFQDGDGCPEPDNDDDGIPDARDQCPNKPESRNGVDDEDGCPEEDTDGDGYIGARDKCPDAPETKNNFQDDDGCPDEIPAAVKKFTGVIEGINFRTGSAEILPGSYNVLERAVAVLTEYPDIRLEISGHTDNVGNAWSNRQLSQQRAEAVRQFFILRGVKPDRLTAVGYGEERPIADNTTRSGKAQNRRTEFRLIGGN